MTEVVTVTRARQMPQLTNELPPSMTLVLQWTGTLAVDVPLHARLMIGVNSSGHLSGVMPNQYAHPTF